MPIPEQDVDPSDHKAESNAECKPSVHAGFKMTNGNNSGRNGPLGNPSRSDYFIGKDE